MLAKRARKPNKLYSSDVFMVDEGEVQTGISRHSVASKKPSGSRPSSVVKKTISKPTPPPSTIKSGLNLKTILNNITNDKSKKTSVKKTDFDDRLDNEKNFKSFREFQELFNEWQKENGFAFRVASSETLKDENGKVNPIYHYKHVVYQCIHYGQPRIRASGSGKRPNQKYLPSGCESMLRLNYCYKDKVLKITTIHLEHNHMIIPGLTYESKANKTANWPARKSTRRAAKSKSPSTAGDESDEDLEDEQPSESEECVRLQDESKNVAPSVDKQSSSEVLSTNISVPANPVAVVPAPPDNPEFWSNNNPELINNYYSEIGFP